MIFWPRYSLTQGVIMTLTPVYVCSISFYEFNFTFWYAHIILLVAFDT